MSGGVLSCHPSTGVQKEWFVGFHLRNDEETNTFQCELKPLILHDVDTDVSSAYLSSFSINQHTVLLY